MRRVLWIVVAVLLGISTTDVSAQDRGGGGGGFWERMSGPGPWFFLTGYLSPCIVGEKEKRLFCRTGEAEVWFNLGASYARAGEEASPELVSPGLQQVSFEPSVDIRLHNLTVRDRNSPIYFGIGMGVHHFWGEDVSLNRGSVEARLGILFPVGERSFGIRYSHRVFLGGFDAEDFGDPLGTFATEGNEGLHTIYFHVTF
jgi:hypothetical protein